MPVAGESIGLEQPAENGESPARKLALEPVSGRRETAGGPAGQEGVLLGRGLAQAEEDAREASVLARQQQRATCLSRKTLFAGSGFFRRTEGGSRISPAIGVDTVDGDGAPCRRWQKQFDHGRN